MCIVGGKRISILQIFQWFVNCTVGSVLGWFDVNYTCNDRYEPAKDAVFLFLIEWKKLLGKTCSSEIHRQFSGRVKFTNNSSIITVDYTLDLAEESHDDLFHTFCLSVSLCTFKGTL